MWRYADGSCNSYQEGKGKKSIRQDVRVDWAKPCLKITLSQQTNLYEAQYWSRTNNLVPCQEELEEGKHRNREHIRQGHPQETCWTLKYLPELNISLPYSYLSEGFRRLHQWHQLKANQEKELRKVEQKVSIWLINFQRVNINHSYFSLS